ncbi:restriction endonuclease [Kangiella sp. HD9-110m-PIT-SAG06]|nr:restriction endonuclease [Kangiella sp. HD9-110m-PIT-SAG06]
MSEFNYKFDDLFNPVLKALHSLGGSGTNDEIIDEIIESLGLSDQEVEDIHRDNTTKLVYRTAWAKTYLKNSGYLENSSRGVWALTTDGSRIESVDKDEVKATIREFDRKRRSQIVESGENLSDEIEELGWETEILEALRSIEPDAFERLSQRLLRELGFVNVEVTGKTGDGGIDGVGAIKIGTVHSFQVVFQSKRYTGSVGSPQIRDFRGAMMGRADKGLFITTGNFTREAKAEAKRDGAPPIDLVNGNQLAEHLKELRLGVKVEQVEKVTIEKKWFDSI